MRKYFNNAGKFLNPSSDSLFLTKQFYTHISKGIGELLIVVNSVVNTAHESVCLFNTT